MMMDAEVQTDYVRIVSGDLEASKYDSNKLLT